MPAITADAVDFYGAFAKTGAGKLVLSRQVFRTLPPRIFICPEVFWKLIMQAFLEVEI